VDELAARLGDPRLRVVDVRWVLGEPGAGRAAYDAGHIPGAIFLDLDVDLADPDGFGAPGRHPLPSPAAFARRLGRTGIGDDALVVVYDDAGGWIAARLWWMLDNLGFNAPDRAGGVAILDGGWAAWLGAGLSTSTDVPSPAPVELHLADSWTHVIDRGEVKARLGELRLLDARGAPRYRGETEPIDPVAGHIPTAISAPWDSTIGDDGRFLSPDALRERLAAFGLGGAAASPVAVYCGSGTSACQHVVAARLAGLPDPVLYVGSYSDWSRSGEPVATGAEPGSAPLLR
jgi:thiosulfate/3-mercaptopyruvate sulfurtransferase